MTKQGLKAIEEVKVGDQVLSYNDNLDIFEYKDVVDVYNNETTELCHIQTVTEEIVCTPNHSILTDEGWKLASELETNDNIKTPNGFARVKSVEVVQLKEKLNVYNLNVLGYHTYVVGNDLLVVHNRCKLGKNMEKSGNFGKTGQDAHHLFPQKFRNKFKKMNIDIDDANLGRWMDASKHRSGAKAYNKLWQEALEAGRVNKTNAIEFAEEFMKLVYDMII